MEYLILLGLLKIVNGAFDELDAPVPVEAKSEATARIDTEPQTSPVTKTQTKKYLRNLAVGGGFNFIRYQQKSEDKTIDANFSMYHGPSLFLSFDVAASKKLFFDLQVKSLSGNVDDGTLTLRRRNLVWKSISLDSIYMPRSLDFDFFGKHGHTGLLLGGQYHVVSILNREQTTVFSYDTKEIGLFSLGLYRHEELSPKWSMVYYMRIQPPTHNFLDDDIQIKFSFDGSVGLIRQFNDAFGIGLYSYGQYQSYDVEYKDETTNSKAKATASLLHSNVEARVVYRF